MLPDGSIMDTVSFAMPPIIPESVWTFQGGDGSESGVVLRFGPRNVWAWSPSGEIATGVTNRYELSIRKIDEIPTVDRDSRVWPPGQVVTTIRRDVDPVPLSETEINEERERIARMVAQANGTGGSVSTLSAVRPHFSSLQFGEDGRLWVAVLSTVESGKEGIYYDVFEPSGEFLARAHVPGSCIDPSSDQMMPIQSEAIWCVASDEFGVNTIRRFRIDWN
jgi:hypothetical protein